jgi:hypothetical protein
VNGRLQKALNVLSAAFRDRTMSDTAGLDFEISDESWEMHGAPEYHPRFCFLFVQAGVRALVSPSPFL